MVKSAVGKASARAAQAAAPPGSLAARLREAPVLANPKLAQRKLRDWLGAIRAEPQGPALADLLASGSRPGKLVLGLADHSPYLFDLLTTDAGRAWRLLTGEPDHVLTELVEQATETCMNADDEAQVMKSLRHMKSAAALLIGMADIGGVWDVPRVIGALTQVADTAVAAAVRFLLREAIASGKLPHLDPRRPDAGCGYVVLGMGKMGAHELNYSSDIDLIIFFDPQAPALSADVEPGPFFVRMTRGLARLLQERTDDGYVFRVDLRLRPDPASTQAAISLDAALRYYETTGQNWERAAMIKARPVGGDLFAGDLFLREISPFIWRRYLDYAAIAEVHEMKRQIHAYRGHDEIAVAGHNVKLGRGGIREIEFFVQTQQLIAGGRDRALRGRGTLDMLQALTAGGWISPRVRDDLASSYAYLRRVEHRLQMVADEQTHELPADPQVLEGFARFMGYPDLAAFSVELTRHLGIVQNAYANLFEDAPTLAAYRGGLTFPADHDDRETLETLARLGFKAPREASERVRRWQKAPYRALRSETAREHLADITPVLIEELARSGNADQALMAFDSFLESVSAGVRLLAVLRRSKDLVAVLAAVLGSAPRLADMVARRPDILGAIIEPAFFAERPSAADLAGRLVLALDQSASLEDFLDRARQFAQEQRFAIGARILSGTLSAAQAGESFARLADIVLRTLHAATEARFAESHGRLKDQETAVIALGKLGGMEMTAGSDLDLIVVYDHDEEAPESDGEKPLYGAQYFARLTQRFINALRVPTNFGVLYDVDMRLRPSGRSGPVATRLDGFEAYQRDEAWTWEHMALTRARVVSSTPAFQLRVERAIRSVLCRKRDARLVAADVCEMRRAIADDKGDGERWNLKHARGGLVDLEFIAQHLQLVHASQHADILDATTARVFEMAQRLGLITVADGELLRKACRLHHDLTQVLRLCLDGPFDATTASPGLLALLARAAAAPNFAALDADLTETQARVRECFVRLVGPV
jgi:glutamate-ammonia-ligase adenylyltransferase